MLKPDNLREFSIDHKGGSHLCRNFETSNPSATKPIYWEYGQNCLNNVCLGPSFEDCKSQFCHAAAKNLVTQEITSYVGVQAYL